MASYSRDNPLGLSAGSHVFNNLPRYFLRQFREPVPTANPYAPWLIVIAANNESVQAFLTRYKINPERFYAHTSLKDAQHRAELLAMDGVPSLIVTVERDVLQ